MGRPRQHRKDLPKRLNVIFGIYYYRPKEGKPINLGREEAEALRRYRELVPDNRKLTTMGDVFDRYLIEIIPTKAPRTQLDNTTELGNLRRSFGHFLPDEITAQDIYKYMDGRGAPVRANREIALLSHIFKKAIRWGVVKRNPCVKGEVERNPEVPRNRYVTDRELDFFKQHASPMIRAYCDFKYLTGMRKGDILTLQKSALQDDGIRYMQRKGRRRNPRTGERSGKERLVEWSPELREVVERILALRRGRGRRMKNPKNACGWGPRRAAPETIYLFATLDGTPYYDERQARASGFDTIWHRYLQKAKASAEAEGWRLEHFTEHDIRAKSGSDAEDAGQRGHKLLGNSEKQFRAAYDRGVERVAPLRRKKS
jgi:integrase